MAFKTEFEFTLPKGFVDEQGNLHRKGVMRLATAKDEIIPLQDFRVKNNRAYLVIILLSRVVTRLGQLPDAHRGPLGLAEVVQVAVDRVGQLVTLLDPLEARLQQSREREVRIARRVRTAKLRARGGLLARVVQRHPHERRTVAPRPGDVHRRLEARH